MISESYHDPQNLTPTALCEDHDRMLFKESGIAPEVVAERGYWTAITRADVPRVFSEKQKRANSLIVPMFSPDGITRSYQIRPDKPFRNKKGENYRYASPSGSTSIVDTHPQNIEAVKDESITLYITEGIKKGDALTSRGLCAIALAGVWNFRPKNGAELLPCFNHIALHRRLVRVVYDSDVMTKPEVQNALFRLVSDLEERGARVEVIYLPDARDGSKQGVDDFLANGGTVEELETLARPFNREGVEVERLSRDEKLRQALGYLWAEWKAMEWKDSGGYTWRNIKRQLLRAAGQHGKVKGDYVETSISQRTLAERSGTRQYTVSGNIRRAEERGEIVCKPGSSPDKPTTYLIPLSASVTRGYHQGDDAGKGKEFPPYYNASFSSGPGSLYPDTPLSRFELERLRSGKVKKTRVPGGDEYAFLERLGPICGHALECLIDAGGKAEVRDLIAAMNRSDRPSRFKARHLKKLTDAEIVWLEGDVVVLAEDWALKLMTERQRGEEYEDERLQRDAHARHRKAYREKNDKPSDPEPGMRPVDDMRQPWSHHPEKCACRECSKRFGRLVGAHVEDCRCGTCASDRRELARKSKKPTPQPTPLSPKPKPVPKPVENDDWLDHPLDCECADCTSPVTRYVRLREVAA